jgi:MraZ protein
VFKGRYVHAVDAKGRTSLPSRFREILEGRGDLRLVITAGLDNCLVAYPHAEWTAFEARVSALPQFDPAVKKIMRLYVSGAVDCEVDKLGRVLIPSDLREEAQLGREVLWAGMGQYLELWDNARFSKMRKDELGSAESQAEVARRLAELGL